MAPESAVPRARGVFVTGTDTDVGKTEVACALLRAARVRGLRAVGMKPVATGTVEGRQVDVECLQAASGVALPPDRVNPYAYVPAIAPHLAAAEAGETIDPERIVACYRTLAAAADLVIVEGAGGWLVPLGPATAWPDLVRQLDIPVWLVVGIRLGCINHALLSALAIRASGARLAGWVANSIDPACLRAEAVIATLRERLPAPLCGVLPYRPDAPAGERAELPPAVLDELLDATLTYRGGSGGFAAS